MEGKKIGIFGLFKRGAEKKSERDVRCSKCGGKIETTRTSIAEDLRRRGVLVAGEPSLSSVMYKCTICQACGSVFCLSCQRPAPDPCPKCGKSNLSPGFADLVQKYYKP